MILISRSHLPYHIIPILILLCYGILPTFGLEFVLRLTEPAEPVSPVSVYADSTVILRCLREAKGDTFQKWLHNGRETNNKILEIHTEGSHSILKIVNYTSDVHDGVYECYLNNTSASIRTKTIVEPIELNKGFRFCKGEENGKCLHADACQVDPLQNVVCICEKGWVGQSCNIPITSTGVTEESYDFLSGVGTIAVLLMLFTVIIVQFVIVLTCWRTNKKIRKAAGYSDTRSEQTPLK